MSTDKAELVAAHGAYASLRHLERHQAERASRCSGFLHGCGV